MAAMWSLSKERNARCFDGSYSSMQAVVERAKFLVGSWASKAILSI